MESLVGKALRLLCVLLALGWLLFEGLWLAKGWLGQDYPAILTSPEGEAREVVAHGRAVTFFPLDVPGRGLLRVDFYGRTKAPERAGISFVLMDQAAVDQCLDPDCSAALFEHNLAGVKSISQHRFSQEGHAMLRYEVEGPGRRYFAASVTGTHLFKDTKVKYYVTGWRSKFRSLLPLVCLGLRNICLALLLLALGLVFGRALGGLWRLMLPLWAYALALLVVVLTPGTILRGAFYGSGSRLLAERGEPLELNAGRSIHTAYVTNALPYAATLLNFEAEALVPEPFRLYSDLYRSPSYDDQLTEAAYSLGWEGGLSRTFVCDSVHAYDDRISLRFWLDRQEGAARILSYTLRQAPLPPIVLKGVESAREFLEEAYWVFLLGGLLSAALCWLALKGGFYLKGATTGAALLALGVLFLPPGFGGIEEPVVRSTAVSARMGLRPFTPYLLAWRNTPREGVDPTAPGYVPNAGSICVANALEQAFVSRSDLYPDGGRAYVKFFTKMHSDFMVSIMQKDVEVRDMVALRLPGSIVSARFWAWAWVLVLVALGLVWAVRTALGREEA